ncbi:MAG: peptide ABC transporter substrate-binding protein [Candidatus Eremiobacteraeota bacterium]|nr:peptide ABC transporter substrate-binding protein [Candidatus Eremiobacteraeota bacterium]
MRRLTRARNFGLAIAIIAALASACTRSGGNPNGTPSDTLHIALYGEPHSLNPLLPGNTADNMLASIAFDLLVTLDDKQRQVPDLAAVVPTLQNGGISRDGKTITYHLRNGVKWQDGVAFSSADVKFTWQAVMNPRNNVVTRRGYDQVASVDTPDAGTVVFHLKHPFAPFIDTVFGESDSPYRILPKHLLEKYPDINQIPFNSLPVGTGPFRVAKWIRGDRIEYVANPNYFRGKPKLARVDVQVVPDMNTQAAMLRSHQTDVIIDLTASKYRDLRDVSGVKIYLAESPQYEGIILNLSHPPLDELPVRKAIFQAIDRESVARNLEYGTATIAKADLSPFYWAFDPNVKNYPYDPKEAAATLDAAGWRVGPGGIRQKNGTPLSLQLVFGQGSETARAVATLIQANLRQVGIDTPIKTYLYSQLLAIKSEGGIFTNGKFDLGVYSWISGADPDNSSQFTCDQMPPNGNNSMRYCSAEMDAAQQIATTTFDRAVRKKQYSIIQQRIATDVPLVVLFYAKLRYALSEPVQNFTPNGISEGWNAYDWSMR